MVISLCKTVAWHLYVHSLKFAFCWFSILWLYSLLFACVNIS